MGPIVEERIKEIFFDVEWADLSTPDDIYGLQITFITTCTSVERIVKLMEQYSKDPEIIVDTLSIFHNNTEISGIGHFPYKMLIAELDEHRECIEHLCNINRGVYLNVLYRVALSLEFQGYSSSVSRLETLLHFRCALEVFRDGAVWGERRRRAGVLTTHDRIFRRHVAATSMDITNTAEVHSAIVKAKGHEEKKIETQKYWETVGNLDETPEFHLPCLFALLLEPFPSAAVERNEENAQKIREIDLSNLRFFQRDILGLLLPLIKNADIKQRFVEMIENILAQDRAKIVFDAETNCSDSLVFNLLFFLLDTAEGCTKPSFVDKIGVNKFPTFCFFAVNRLLSLSKMQLVNEYKQNTKNYTTMRLIQFGGQKIQKYLDFVCNVICGRKSEVYGPLEQAVAPNDLYSVVEVVEQSFPDRRATSVSELIYDTEFMNNVFTMQALSPVASNNLQMLFVCSMALTYRNGLKTAALDTIRQIKDIDDLTIKRLLVNYTERGEEYIENRRVIINDIFRNRVLPVDRDSLRMANLLVGDISNSMSNIYIEIKHYDECKEKVEWLKGVEERREEEELSEEENMGAVQLPQELGVYENLSDDEIKTKLKSEIVEHYMEREDTVPLAMRLQNNPALLEEIVHKEMLVIRGKIKMYGSYKMKLRRKRMMKEHILEMTGKKIEWLVFYVKSVFSSLEGHLLTNRKLFLHKAVFPHCCSVLCYFLGELLGKVADRSISRHFEPTELIRASVSSLLSLTNGNPVLIDKAGFNSEILGRTLELAQARYLLGSGELEDFEKLCERVRNPPVQSESPPELGDVPEEYIDPLTCVLMEHPVQLLTSNVIIDRSTLNQIMLNDRVDPFSRMSLDDTKYIPLPELENEIKEFIKKSRT